MTEKLNRCFQTSFVGYFSHFCRIFFNHKNDGKKVFENFGNLEKIEKWVVINFCHWVGSLFLCQKMTRVRQRQLL